MIGVKEWLKCLLKNMLFYQLNFIEITWRNKWFAFCDFHSNNSVILNIFLWNKFKKFGFSNMHSSNCYIMFIMDHFKWWTELNWVYFEKWSIAMNSKNIQKKKIALIKAEVLVTVTWIFFFLLSLHPFPQHHLFFPALAIFQTLPITLCQIMTFFWFTAFEKKFGYFKSAD